MAPVNDVPPTELVVSNAPAIVPTAELSVIVPPAVRLTLPVVLIAPATFNAMFCPAVPVMLPVNAGCAAVIVMLLAAPLAITAILSLVVFALNPA